jgi:integrase
MSLYKRPDSGVYWYEFLFGGRRYRGSTKHTNLRAAERVENSIKTKLANSRFGIEELKPVPLFRDFAMRFFEMVKPELKPKAYLRYAVSVGLPDAKRKKVACNLSAYFATKPLHEIRADAINLYKEKRLADGMSSSTVNRDLACLRRILSKAVQLEIISTSPFFARRVEFQREYGRERILSFNEERCYLAVAKQPLCDVATLMLEMGLRPSEVFALRCEDLHLWATSAYVHIPRGKTQNATRDVAVTAKALLVLKARLSHAKGPNLFPLRVGTGFEWNFPMTTVHKAHAEALQKSGVNPPFQIYDLRHTYGTRAIEAGMDSMTLARLMGHADLKTTQRYVHLSKRHLAEAQAKVEQFRAVREIAEAEAVKGASTLLQ